MNAETEEIMGSLSTGRAGWPAVQPGGRIAYVPNDSSDPSLIYVIDTRNNSFTTSFPVNNFTEHVVFHPRGTTAYATNSFSQVQVIDTRLHAVVNNIDLSSGASACTVHPAGTTLYCAGVNRIHVVDIPTGQVSATIPLGSTSSRVDLAISDDGRWLYVPGLGSPNLLLVDTLTEKVVDSFDSNGASYGVSVDSSRNQVYLPDFINDTLYILSADELETVASVPIPGAYGVEAHPLGERVYVTDRTTSSVWPVDTTSHQIGSPIAVAGAPLALAFAPPRYPSNLRWPLPTERSSQDVSLRFGGPWPFGQCGGLDKLHAGTDYPNPAGTVVRAIADGVVKDTFVDPTFAGRVVIEHDVQGLIFTSVSWHVDASVAVAQEVDEGETLGTLAAIGGPHLHLGIRLGGFEIRPSGLGALPQTNCPPDLAFPEQFIDTELASFLGSVVFSDGFESGDTGAWTEVVP